MFDQLAQIHEAKVWDAERHVRQSGPGQVQRLKAHIRHHLRGKGIGRARQQDAALSGQGISKCLDVWF